MEPATAPATGPPATTAPVVLPARRLVRSLIAGLLAVVSALSAWVLLRHGIRTDDFPPFIAGQQTMPITRYSGPWLTAAAGMALVAVLFLLFALLDLVRWSRAKRERG